MNFAEWPLVVRGVFNGPKPTGKPWLQVRNYDDDGDESKPVEILIYDEIGKDWWDDSGIGAKEFANILKPIAKNREILVCINSPGGNVFDGMAIYSQLKLRREHVVCRIDGVAASIASVIAMAGREVQMPKNALLMIHDPAGMCVGDSGDMRKMAEMLDTVKGTISGVYEEKTGKPKKQIHDAMSEETWFEAEDAKAFGLIDTIGDEISISAHFDFSAFRKTPAALKQADNKKGRDNMNIIALLRKHGVTIKDNATEAEILAAYEKLLVDTRATGATNAITKEELDAIKDDLERLKAARVPTPTPAPAPTAQADPAIVSLQTQVAQLTAERESSRRVEITNAIDVAIHDSRIPANSRDGWLSLALGSPFPVDSNPVVAQVRGLPPNLPGGEPLSAMVEITSENIVDIEKHILSMWCKDKVGDGEVAPAARKRGGVRAAAVAKHRNRILQVWNANVISADLKRVVILQQAIRAFARRLIPLRAFSTVFNGVALQGTNEVVVPYYALETAASVDFIAANGYVMTNNSNTEGRKITINKRKYQPWALTSEELRRQPYLDTVRIMGLKAEKLALDVSTDIMSVITLANFGASAKVVAANAITHEDVADLKGVADSPPLEWPQMGRSLVLNSPYDVKLLKDVAISSALNFGSDDPITKGMINQIYGFDYYTNANVPTNGQNLGGFINFISAILVAFAPVEPTPEVRSQLTRYEVITEPEIGAVFEYRMWGNPDMDQTRQVVEANYGFAVGEANALKRITTA